jgi:23S rRNA (guanosine2251-2'-O)-methyltransferase
MEQEQDMIFGLRPVIEALKAGKPFDRIIIKNGLQGALYRELTALLREKAIPWNTAPPERFVQYSRKNHQGVIAWLAAIEYQNIENIVPLLFEKGKDPLLLILNGISDVRNFGAIARSAECFGADAIILPEKGSVRVNADALKTSAGALHTLPVCRTSSIMRTIAYLRESGIKIICSSEKSEKALNAADLTGPVALVLGSEERGISREVLEEADLTVMIPITGTTESLNVSVAAGIMLYETVRQRGDRER